MNARSLPFLNLPLKVLFFKANLPGASAPLQEKPLSSESFELQQVRSLRNLKQNYFLERRFLL